MNFELEEQYQQGLELKMSGSSRRHAGLGFQEVDNNGRGTVDEAANSVDLGSLASEEKEESRDDETVVPNESEDKDKVEEKVADDSEKKSPSVKAANKLTSGFVAGGSS